MWPMNELPPNHDGVERDEELSALLGYLREHRGVDLTGYKLPKAPDGTIRVWSAGCASGQEPFTAAMVLAEAMGLESFCRRVKIYATDLDEPALQQARRARYPIAELDAVPDAMRGRYFEQHEGVAALHNGLRRAVIFGRHDLLEDAPISRIDLLLCRNTLMYFNAAAQSRILGRLHFALLERGYIMLGRAEMLLSHADSFAPIDLKHRVAAKGSSERSPIRTASISMSWSPRSFATAR
jgi:two-component system, chemotaxis family, CheB/CheR fusion protein